MKVIITPDRFIEIFHDYIIQFKASKGPLGLFGYEFLINTSEPDGIEIDIPEECFAGKKMTSEFIKEWDKIHENKDI